MSCPFAQQQQQQQSSVSLAAFASHQHQSSSVEQALRSAQTPLQFPNAHERVQAGQYSGIQLNKEEEQQFHGPVPLSQYQVNQDPNPEVIKKRVGKLRYQQEVAV